MGWLDFTVPNFDLAAQDKVARWLVLDLVTRGGEKSPGELTDAAFAVLHPEKGGRRIEAHETALIDEYKRIRREIVEPILGAKPTSTGKYKPHDLGFSRYSIRDDGIHLDTRLRDMKKRGVLQIEDEDIDTFQRIANVEVSGGVQGLNSWDSAIMSIGFVQLTLTHGKLQSWIARAKPAFARYGIVLESTRKWTFDGSAQKAIVGAQYASELRNLEWGDRFYRAGLDDDIIKAEVEEALARMEAGKKTASDELDDRYPAFSNAYDGSLPFRGLYQEALNNLPRGAIRAIRLASKEASDDIEPAAYYELLKKAVPDGFEQWAQGAKLSAKKIADYRQKGKNIVRKTASLRVS